MSPGTSGQSGPPHAGENVSSVGFKGGVNGEGVRNGAIVEEQIVGDGDWV